MFVDCSPVKTAAFWLLRSSMRRYNRGADEESPPIPTYDQATTPTPTSTTAFLGPSEISHDAERQGLLGQVGSSRRSNVYQPPTVESARSSMDLSVSSGGSSARHSTDSLREEISQMEIDEPNYNVTTWKRISGLTSNIHLPFRRWFPSLTRARAMLPNMPEGFTFNSILLIRALALLFVLSLAYILFFSGMVRWKHRPAVLFLEEDVRKHVQGAVNETRIQEYLQHLTQWDHVAGTKGNFYLAKFIESHMNGNGLDTVSLEKFEVYLNYPRKNGRRVAIVSPPEKLWQAKLEEEKVYSDREQTLVFHGLSKSGNVTGPLIYANYGAREDFQKLKGAGIKVDGSIALVRYGGSQGDRALKVKNAELAGAVGCIIYSDPKEEGIIKGKSWPEGRYRTPDSVERGTVALTGFVAGDVLSPGFPSLVDDGHRIRKEDSPALNKIPSVPIAWRDAQILLQSLRGHGKKLDEEIWKGGVPDVEWWTGDEKSPIVNLENELDESQRQPIYNIWGKIEGSEQLEKSVIVGNHYDSWCFGGADPSSGTAVMLELIQVFGDLMKYGWKPRRTIEFLVWDAEEYNLIGSTEHVEARIDELRKNGYAYINVDVAATGSRLKVDASPLFSTALTRVLKRTTDPSTGKIMNNLWQEKDSKLGALGAGSDYVAFQDFAGVSSIDLTFKGSPYPYHSCYENFDWMARFGDPGFQYHKLMAQIVGLLLLELADEPVLQFDLLAYAKAIDGYKKRLENHVTNLTRTDPAARDKRLNFTKLHAATRLLTANAKEVQKWLDDWTATHLDTGIREGDVSALDRWNFNDKLAAFETNLLDVDGGVSFPLLQLLNYF